MEKYVVYNYTFGIELWPGKAADPVWLVSFEEEVWFSTFLHILISVSFKTL